MTRGSVKGANGAWLGTTAGLPQTIILRSAIALRTAVPRSSNNVHTRAAVTRDSDTDHAHAYKPAVLFVGS